MRQKISMTCPTRGRTKMLESLIDNIYSKGSDNLRLKDYFELIFVVDNDDVDTIKLLKEKFKKYNTIKILQRERSPNFNRDYPNFAAKHATGDLIWGIGDDIEILIDKWDQVLLEKVNLFEKFIKKGYLDNIFYSWNTNCFEYLINIDVIEDHKVNTSKINNYEVCRPEFPIITREAYEKIKVLVPSEWKFWGADYALGEIYREAGRVFTLKDIIISHNSSDSNIKEFKSGKYSKIPHCEDTRHIGSLYQHHLKGGGRLIERPIIAKYTELLINVNKKRLIPSRICLDTIARPLESLAKEINFIEKQINLCKSSPVGFKVFCCDCDVECFPAIHEFESANLATCESHPQTNLKIAINVKNKNILFSKNDSYDNYEVQLMCTTGFHTVPLINFLSNKEYFCNDCKKRSVVDNNKNFKLDISSTIDCSIRNKELLNKHDHLLKKYDMISKAYKIAR